MTSLECLYFPPEIPFHIICGFTGGKDARTPRSHYITYLMQWIVTSIRNLFIDTGSPGLEAFQQHAAGKVGVETNDDIPSVSAGAGEPDKTHLTLGKISFHDLQHSQVLAVD